MITELRLINYRRFACVRIPLSPITVFIGPNAAGKSTIASALFTMATIMRLGLRAAFPEGFFSFDRIINYSPEKFGYDSPRMGLGISGKTGDIAFDYDILFARDAESPSGFQIDYQGIDIRGPAHVLIRNGPMPAINPPWPTMSGEPTENGWGEEKRESFFVLPRSLSSQKDEHAIIDRVILEQNNFSGMLKKIRRFMQGLLKFQLSPSAIGDQNEQYDGSGRQPLLKADGGNLPQLMQYLHEERRDLVYRVRHWLNRYAEGGGDVADVGVATYDNKVLLNLFEKGRDGRPYPVGGHLISDGFKVFTALAALASCATRPTIAFFEEPETFLHPHKLPILYDIFRDLADRDDNPTQVLLSSHSPYFIDMFKETPEAVLLLNDGAVRRLTEISNHENILSLYSLGEAWYANVFGLGNP